MIIDYRESDIFWGGERFRVLSEGQDGKLVAVIDYDGDDIATADELEEAMRERMTEDVYTGDNEEVEEPLVLQYEWNYYWEIARRMGVVAAQEARFRDPVRKLEEYCYSLALPVRGQLELDFE